MDHIDVLDTKRLTLRKTCVDDTAVISDLIANPRVRYFLGGPVPSDQHAQTVASYLATENDERVWTVNHKLDRNRIGLVFVTRHQDQNEHEISYMFHPDYWHMGFAYEAARSAIDDYRQRHPDSALIAETQSANTGSIRLLERLGMTERERIQRFGTEQVIMEMT